MFFGYPSRLSDMIDDTPVQYEIVPIVRIEEQLDKIISLLTELLAKQGDKHETHEYLIGDVWPSYPHGTKPRYGTHTGPTTTIGDNHEN